MPAVLDPRVYWECDCGATHVTTMAEPHTPLHPCPKLSGLMVPYVPRGDRAVHRRMERGDYVGDELVARDDDGNVVMSVVTEHEDGHTDCTVYAGTAQMSVQGQDT